MNKEWSYLTKITENKPITVTKVKTGDRISFKEAKNGQDAQGVLGDVLDLNPVKVTFNNRVIEVMPEIFLNGFAVDLSIELNDRARIEYKKDILVRDVLKSADLELGGFT